MRRILRIVALPLAVLAVFLLLYAVWLALDLPPEETIVEIARGYLDRYGVVIVLISAYLEGLLLIGWYFPGTLVIIFALIAAGPDVPRVAQVAALAGSGLFAAYVTNFLAGNTAGTASCSASACARRWRMLRPGSPATGSARSS